MSYEIQIKQKPLISESFADELTDKEARDAYVEAQTRVRVAQQIRTLRQQRDLSQKQLGDMMGKPQGNVARLEDKEVARYTLTSLFELASAFDVALIVEFADFPEFLERTEDLSANNLKRKSFDRDDLNRLCNIYEPVALKIPHGSFSNYTSVQNAYLTHGSSPIPTAICPRSEQPTLAPSLPKEHVKIRKVPFHFGQAQQQGAVDGLYAPIRLPPVRQIMGGSL